MPRVALDQLPDRARLWVFGTARPLIEREARQLLDTVDRYLDDWKAHGTPLTSARAWQDDRFLIVAVDEAAAGASGCSIDGLFRQLQTLERTLGTSLVGGGRIFFRDSSSAIVSVPRDEFSDLAEQGAVGPSTPVLDPSITRLGEWRKRFETRADQSWHRDLLGARASGD